MSGGVAYVYDPADNFRSRCNREMVELEALSQSDTGRIPTTSRPCSGCSPATSGLPAAPSRRACSTDWDTAKGRFVKVIPQDYKRVLLAEARARAESREPAFNELVGAVVNG